MIFKNCSKIEFRQRCKAYRIICFGASSMFQRAVSTLDISDRVIGLADNDQKKWGTSISVGAHTYKIDRPESLLTEDRRPYIILITSIYYEEIKRQLDGNKNLQHEELYIYPLILQYLPDYTTTEFYQKRIVEPSLIKLKEVFDIQGVEEDKQNILLEEKKSFALKEDSVVLPQLTFVITNQCTLRCKNCNMLIPYTKNDYFVTLEDAKSQIVKFLSGVDEIFLFSLIGGEVLLHPQFDQILEFSIAQRKIYRIMITINATLIPSQEILNLLTNEKVFVYISDYGFQKDNIKKLTELLSYYNIKFAVKTDWEWSDYGKVVHRNKDRDILRYEYLRCFLSNNCRTLYRNKIFVCTRAAIMHEHHVGKYSAEDEMIDLSNDLNTDELREKIKEFLLIDTANSCNYCDGATAKPKWIKPGEQLGERSTRSEIQ